MARVGILGGTGPAGRGLALRLAVAGHDVVVGSRQVDRAEAVVGALAEEWPDRDVGPRLAGGSNRDAAGCDLVVVATPWEVVDHVVPKVARELAGKVVVSMVAPIHRVGGRLAPLRVPLGSAAAHVQAAAPEARVVAALHHVPAAMLAALDGPVDCDVVVCADDRGARDVVSRLLDAIPGIATFDGGPLAGAGPVEAFTVTLVQQTIRRKAATGIRFTALDGH